jgi:glycosyltransferase involved in cell wall biosynthesis/2-polyprenyl-3-methyl-5-hydroxy-6-metoxy-1,4-benzoquinol methylase
MIKFTGERIVPGSEECEPTFALKMYQEHIARYYLASQFVNDKEVLDVGCGVGYGSFLLANKGAKRVLAFDSSADAISHAWSYYAHAGIEYKQLNAESFELNHKFDVIVCFELIEHVQNQEKALINIYNHLKDDGILIISTPRKLPEKRSTFHVTELSFQDFHNLLAKYFKQSRYYFQNNHFVSYVGDSFLNDSQNRTAVEVLKDIYTADKCDTYICIAAKTEINLGSITNVMVANDESYVKHLENDIAILRGIENTLNNEVNNQRTRANDFSDRILRLEGNLTAKRTEIEYLESVLQERVSELKDKEEALNEIRKELDKFRDIELTLSEARQELDKFRDIELALNEARKEQDRLRDNEGRIAAQVADYEYRETIWLEKVSDLERNEDSSKKTIQELNLTLMSIYGSRGWKIISTGRNLIKKVIPPGTRRRKLVGRIIHTIWNEQTHSSSKSDYLQFPVTYTKRPSLLRRTINYYRQNGMRKTMARATLKISGKRGGNISSAKSIAYFPELYQAETPQHAKTKIKKISFLIGCLEGESKVYRVFNLIELLTKRGIECCTFYDINVDKLEQVIDSDLLVLFRAAMSPALNMILEKFKQKNVPVIFDIDDLVFEPDSVCYVDGIRGWSEDQKAEYLNGVKRYRQTLERCDFATCTTSFLAERIQKIGIKSYVIPNTINETQYRLALEYTSKNRVKETKVKIGYFSGTYTHNKDFQEATRAVGEILSKYKFVELHVIGSLDLPQELGKFENRIIKKPLMPHLDMLKYLSEIDINLAPLEQNNPFTAGKSELKIFESALFGVPTVASQTDSYSRCIQEGVNGFTASCPEQWFDKISALVENSELRTKIGNQAKADFTKAFYIENVIDSVIKVYEEIVDSSGKSYVNLEHLDIAWVIPDPFIGSGGHRSIFRAVRNLSKYGHKLTMYFTGELAIENIRNMVNQHFYDLSDVKFIKYDGTFGHHHCCFATHWTTVYTMMRHRENINYPFYYVQDYEPLFSPMGTEYILSENTYKMGLTNITSGPWMALKLKNKFGAEADFFRFPIDTNIYNTNSRRTKTNKNIIFFARPEMPRRCYDLGILALRIVKERLPDVEIILFGSAKIDSKAVPFEHTNLGLLPDLMSLSKLYRNADLGIVFSTTNPSLVPYEMMACELAVGDIRLEDSIVNYESEENIFFLNPVPEMMAKEMVEIMKNDDLRQRKAKSGYNFSQTFPDEDGMGRRIEELIKRKITG